MASVEIYGPLGAVKNQFLNTKFAMVEIPNAMIYTFHAVN